MRTKKRSVAELMNPDVVCLPPEATVREAEQIAGETGLSAGRRSWMPAAARSASFRSAILPGISPKRATAGASGRFYSDVEDYQEIAELKVDRSSTPVSELMSDEVYSVTRETGVAVAANIMRERRIHRLMVTDRGRLVGIVTSLDLLRIVEELG